MREMWGEQANVILSIAERIVLFNILPEKGTFATVKAVTELRTALGLTEEERIRIGYREVENGAQWDTPLDVDIPMSVESYRVAKETLEAFDKRAEIAPEHVSLYEKFVLARTLVAVP